MSGLVWWKWWGWVVVVLVGGLLLGLVGCCNDSGQLFKVSGEVIIIKVEQVKEFILLCVYLDQKNDGLLLVLEFLCLLVGIQDFDMLVCFEEKVGIEDSSWMLFDDGLILCYLFVEVGKEFSLVVFLDLLVVDGSCLGKELKQKVFSGELKLVVGFVLQGSVLFVKDSCGLLVVLVNVFEVDVEFLCVCEKDLLIFFSQYQCGGCCGSWELSSDYECSLINKLVELVYVNCFILGGKQNEWVLIYLLIQDIKELQELGLYFVLFKCIGDYEGEFDIVFFLVSDIGLYICVYKDKLFVYIVGFKDGVLLKGIDLCVFDVKGEVVLKGSIDGNGNVLLNYILDVIYVLVVSSGKDISFLLFNQLVLDLSEFVVVGCDNVWFDVYVWFGCDLYCLGEIVCLFVLLCDNDGKLVKV